MKPVQPITISDGTNITSLNRIDAPAGSVDPNGVLNLDNGVKVYRALLTQTNTDAPTATVLQNTLGGTVVWTRSNTGRYDGTLAGAFATGTTMVMIGDPLLTGSLAAMYTAQACWVDANTVSVNTREVVVGDGTAAFTDDRLTSTPIEILVYP